MNIPDPGIRLVRIWSLLAEFLSTLAVFRNDKRAVGVLKLDAFDHERQGAALVLIGVSCGYDVLRFDRVVVAILLCTRERRASGREVAVVQKLTPRRSRRRLCRSHDS